MVDRRQFEQQKKIGEDASRVLRQAAALTTDEEQKAIKVYAAN